MPSMLERLLVWYARRFPLRRGKLRAIDSLWRVAAGRHGTRRIAVLKHGELRMPCDLSEMLQRQYYFFGTYSVEEAILECWEGAARDAGMIFDVGANAGIYSLAAKSVRPGATIHAFEPTPEIAARLREAAALNGLQDLHVHEVAVSSENGVASLVRFRGELGTNEGMNFIVTAAKGASAEPVRTVCLDGFCEDHAIERIDLLKLDVQGQEPRALAGARGLLSAGRVGTIFTELNWSRDAAGSCPAAESIRILGEAGYRFSRPARRLEWKPAGDWLRPLSDVVARRRP